VQLYESPGEVPADFGPSAVTIGKFDGLHLGHRAVIARLLGEARARGLVPTALTFDRNPLSVLAPEKCPASLVSNAQKLELLADAGLEATLMVTFDKAFSALPPEAFVSDILVDALHAGLVLVGRDFRFGVQGSGTVETLERLGAELGFEVLVVADVAPSSGGRLSSSGIRGLLEEGRVAEAAELLGYLPRLRSVVVHGEQRGRTLGYPTANLSPAVEGFVPADGVYAAWMTVGGARYPAAVSIGNNPTFGGVPEKQVEAHALDQMLDIYDEVIQLEFVDYIRGMRKFEGADALAAQMRTDEDRIRTILGVQPRTV
jgi:riboflavin kinase/FMN adenylyltransferase